MSLDRVTEALLHFVFGITIPIALIAVIVYTALAVRRCEKLLKEIRGEEPKEKAEATRPSDTSG